LRKRTKKPKQKLDSEQVSKPAGIGVEVKEPVLIIAAHPDDEILGCGGTIAKLADNGYEVRLAILAEGLTSRDRQRDRSAHEDQLIELRQAAWKACQIVGASSVELTAYPDNRMDSVDRLDVVKSVEDLIRAYQPKTVYTHHSGDVNIDHRRIHEATVTACRPQPGNRVRRLLFFEVASSTEWQPPSSAPHFAPNVFVDIRNTLERKLEALRMYETEMRAWPHARSIRAVEHQARWRGATAGMEAAEAFMLGRELD
jgi:LmbE family N-acetylglucosaminyl deacetylase